MYRFSTFDFQINEFCHQSGLNLKDAVIHMRSAGYNLIDADVNTLTPENQQIFDDAGIGINLIYVVPDYEKDPHDQEQKILERCQRAKAKFLMLIPLENAADPEAGIQRNFSIMNELVPKLTAIGVTPVMEDFDSADRSYRSPEGLRRYLDHVPGLKCCFDTGNFHAFQYDHFEAYKLFRNDIAHLHLKDIASGEQYGPGHDHNGHGIFCGAPTGDGILELDRFIKMLIADGYQGDFSLEHCPMNDQWAASVRSVERVREILGQNR